MTLCLTNPGIVPSIGFQEAELLLPPGNMGRAVDEWLDGKALTLHFWKAVIEKEFREVLPLTQEPTGQAGAPPSNSNPSPPVSILKTGCPGSGTANAL